MYPSLIVFFTSCGSRKSSVEKEDSAKKIDSTAIVIQEDVIEKNNNIEIIEDNCELEIIPIDITREIEVDGKTYRNVKIKYKKSKKNLVDTTKEKVSKKATNDVSIKKESKEKVFKRQVDKKESYAVYWGWFLILLLIVLFFYARKKLSRYLF